MEIRATSKDYKRFKKYKTEIPITQDDKLEISVIMIQTTEGQLVEWTRGRKNIESFLKYGYVRITKQCPYRHRKCIGEKCSLYFVKNNTGDCVHIWNQFK